MASYLYTEYAVLIPLTYYTRRLFPTLWEHGSNSIRQSPSPETDSRSNGKKYPYFYGIRRFHIVSTGVHSRAFSCLVHCNSKA
jgi:hypothetical protein